MRARPNQLLAYMMWLLPLSFFSFQFILRLWPSLMMEQIMLQYTIDASSFGLLAAIYYYGYAGMQIPVAALLDKLGPRVVTAGCALLCGLATLLFLMTDNWTIALLSRMLVGIGSAGGFLASSKVISQWFSKEAYSRMVGFTFTGGLLGAIYGGKPISLLVASHGWQQVALTLGIVSCVIGIAALMLLREPKISNNQEKMSLAGFKQLLRMPQIWLLALANMLMVGALEGFADVWGVNYLVSTYLLPKSEAAQVVSFIFFGMLFGGPLLALLSRKTGHYAVIAGCGLGMGACMLLLLFNPITLSVPVLQAIMFCIGLMCCYQVIVFAAGSQLVPGALLGVTVAFLNSINMLGGSFFHTLIGQAMDWFWEGGMEGSIKLYSHHTYVQSLMIIPMCAVVGACVIVYLGRQKQAVRLEREQPCPV